MDTNENIYSELQQQMVCLQQHIEQHSTLRQDALRQSVLQRVKRLQRETYVSSAILIVMAVFVDVALGKFGFPWWFLLLWTSFIAFIVVAGLRAVRLRTSDRRLAASDMPSLREMVARSTTSDRRFKTTIYVYAILLDIGLFFSLWTMGHVDIMIIVLVVSLFSILPSRKRGKRFKSRSETLLADIDRLAREA